jgi:hypothetical protein
VKDTYESEAHDDVYAFGIAAAVPRCCGKLQRR